MTLPANGYVQQVEVVVGGTLPRAGFVQPVENAGGGAGIVTGSGVAGQVTFWTGAHTVSGSNSMLWDNTSLSFQLRQVSTLSGFNLGYRFVGDGFVNDGDAAVLNEPYLQWVGKNANEYFVISSYDFGHMIDFRNAHQACEFHGWDNTASAWTTVLTIEPIPNGGGRIWVRNRGDSDGIQLAFDTVAIIQTTIATSMDFGVANSAKIRFSTSEFQFASSLAHTWSSGAVGAASDIGHFRASAGVLQQSYGGQTQEYQLYSTTDSDLAPANYERMRFRFNGTLPTIAFDILGTGTSRNLVIANNSGTTGGNGSIIVATNSINRWIVTAAAGHFVTNGDNANTIGLSGSNRPSSIYLGTSVEVQSNTGLIKLGASGDVVLNWDAANILSLKNGANAQTWRVYGSATKYAQLTHNGTNVTLSASAGVLIFSDAGGSSANTNGTQFQVNTLDIGLNGDCLLVRDGANQLAMKNGANAQEIRVYGTTTGNKYLSLKHDGTSCLITQQAGLGQIAFGTAAKNAADTAGYLCLPSSAGAPTGVPASIPTGQIPTQIDSTNKKLYAYVGGAWTKAQVAGVDVIFG